MVPVLPRRGVLPGARGTFGYPCPCPGGIGWPGNDGGITWLEYMLGADGPGGGTWGGYCGGPGCATPGAGGVVGVFCVVGTRTEGGGGSVPVRPVVGGAPGGVIGNGPVSGRWSVGP